MNTTTPGDQERPTSRWTPSATTSSCGTATARPTTTASTAGASDAAGTPLGRRFRDQHADLRRTRNAAVSMAGDGRFVVTWESNEPGRQQRRAFTARSTHPRRTRRHRVPGQHAPPTTIRLSPRSPWTTAATTWSPGAARARAIRTACSGGATSPRATGTITGTVYHDVDGDGDLAGAATFAGATVRLFRDGGDGAVERRRRRLRHHHDHRRRRLYAFGGLATAPTTSSSTRRRSGADPSGPSRPTAPPARHSARASPTASGVLYGGPRSRSPRTTRRPYPPRSRPPSTSSG